MKSRRKIWSLPMALVTALLLVGLLGAAVLAQVNEAPKKGTQIPDASITIGADASTDEVDLTDVDDVEGGAQPAFTDAEDQAALQYTAMSSAPRVASPSFGTEATGDNPGIVDDWWDALGGADNTDCRKKAARLGFSLTFDGDDTDTDPDNAPAVLADDTQTPIVAASEARGLCDNFDDFVDDTDTPNVNEEEVAQLMVVQAFHWDMLSGAEMIAAATAGGLSNPSAYGGGIRGSKHCAARECGDPLHYEGRSRERFWDSNAHQRWY